MCIQLCSISDGNCGIYHLACAICDQNAFNYVTCRWLHVRLVTKRMCSKNNFLPHSLSVAPICRPMWRMRFTMSCKSTGPPYRVLQSIFGSAIMRPVQRRSVGEFKGSVVGGGGGPGEFVISGCLAPPLYLGDVW